MSTPGYAASMTPAAGSMTPATDNVWGAAQTPFYGSK